MQEADLLARTPRTAPRPQRKRTGTNRGSTRPRPQPGKSAIDLQVLSVSRAIAYIPSDREVCISIANPGVSATVLSPKFAAVLRVSFSDIAAPSPFPFDQLFDTDHARAIVEFVTRWADVDRIVVHCVGGVSRSPAVALAIAELLGQPTDELERQFPMWNTWVRQQLVKAGRAHVPSRRRVRDRA